MLTYLLVILTGFFAGIVDSSVGGGGLVQLPSLFLIFADLPSALILGINKFGSFSGTFIAALRYLPRLTLNFKVTSILVLVAGFTSLLGAATTKIISPEIFKPLTVVILIAVFVYTFLKPALVPNESKKMTSPLLAIFLTGLIGYYDGFLGPGTGNFLLFAYIFIAHLKFVEASAVAKIVNLSTNFTAISFFIYNGDILWSYAAVLAIANCAGSYIGSGIGLKGNIVFLRKMYLWVVAVLILKLLYDQLSSSLS